MNDGGEDNVKGQRAQFASRQSASAVMIIHGTIRRMLGPLDHRFTGRSIMAFGAASVVVSLAILFTRGGSCDVTSGLAIIIGWYVMRGNSTALEWGIGCMGLVIVAFLVMALSVIFDWSNIRTDIRSVGGSIVPALMWLIFLPWAVLNLVLCIQLIRRARRVRRGLCPQCAYPLGDSPTCTECGTGVR